MRRALDVLLAMTALIALLPFMALIALAVRLGLGGPVLFHQVRTGLHGQSFMLLKFRTMRDAFDPAGGLLPDGERLTRLGRFLRSTSFDELPQLWNVIQGDMSVVGPRPLLPEYLPLYSPEEARRHDVRPGITGWAQVKGRNGITWQQRFALDLWYLEHRSLRLDLYILFLTVWKVLRREGIAQRGQPTMERFRGSAA